MAERIGQCHCGDVTIRCEGEPAKVAMCHCLDCQRRTGSAFGFAAFYARDRVTTQGAVLRTFERTSDSGSLVRFHFCDRCGSNLYWEPERMPTLIGVAAGAFADSDLASPELSVWTRRKHPWLGLPAEMKCVD